HRGHGRMTSKHCIAFAGATLLAAGLLPSMHSARAASDGPLRVLILTGDDDHGARDTTPILRRILAGAGRFDVRLSEAPAGLTTPTLEGFDLVVDNGAHLASGSESEAALAAFVESGKGLVVAHASIVGPASPACAPVDGDADTEPRVAFLGVRLVRPEHP